MGTQDRKDSTDYQPRPDGPPLDYGDNPGARTMSDPSRHERHNKLHRCRCQYCQGYGDGGAAELKVAQSDILRLESELSLAVDHAEYLDKGLEAADEALRWMEGDRDKALGEISSLNEKLEARLAAPQFGPESLALIALAIAGAEEAAGGPGTGSAAAWSKLLDEVDGARGG